MTYGKRLSQAMREAGIDRKTLASELEITVHAIGMVITAAGGKERWLSRENHLKAAKFLKVDPNWLLSGDVPELHTPQAMKSQAAELSPTAQELGWLYDQIPIKDRIRRAVAYNAATQQILNVLQELNAGQSSPVPVGAAPARTRSKRNP